MLKLYQTAGHFASRGEGNIEIITCQKESILEQDPQDVKELKKSRNKIVFEKVVRELIDPLKKRFPWAIEFQVKNDPNGIFHARHLEAQAAIVLFDRGLDLFKPDKSIKRNILKLDNGSFDHLRECRNLENVKFE